LCTEGKGDKRRRAGGREVFFFFFSFREGEPSVGCRREKGEGKLLFLFFTGGGGESLQAP